MHRVLSRTLSLVFMLGLLTSCSCMDQYNPYPHWQKLEQERQTAQRVLPQLTPEGKLPASLLGGEAADEELVFKPEQVYQTYCVACHGPGGEGNPAMNARDFTDPQWQSIASDEEIAAVILHGALNAPQEVPSLQQRQQFKLQYPTMVSWQHLFATDPEQRQVQLAELVNYIRQFKK